MDSSINLSSEYVDSGVADVLSQLDQKIQPDIIYRLSTLENCDHIYKIDQEGQKLEKI